MTYMPTYYEILSLPEDLYNESNIPAQTFRKAYRRALLQNHPDKSTKPTVNAKRETYSIDQISEAFSILSDPKCRAKYNKDLKLQNATTNTRRVKGRQVSRTGIETVDLDDMENNEEQGIWYKSCRCGDERGFLISEADLDEAADDGELSVGCRGCSLWVKVLFGVVDDETSLEASDRGGTRHENSA